MITSCPMMKRLLGQPRINMKLYATTTSERASKGQGGKWLDIEVKDSNKRLIAVMKVKPFVDSVGDGIKIELNCAPDVYCEASGDNVTIKGNKQKGECIFKHDHADNEGIDCVVEDTE